MKRRPPRSTQGVSSAASDVYKRQTYMLAFCKQLLEFSDYNSLTIDTLVKLLCAYLVKIDTTLWDTAYLKEEDNERKVKISQIAIKRKLRFQSIFGMLLT
eukprot:TRINITY_DN54461_c0_g1_i1.p2 TRINITY_DN54461_c0_g1~~TRINITY_DN54461_c0_g1_i1.p2  ORF type:complete len:100 (+),score=19.17 TRINITY_DN54461_c0_g1_i1:81-380(+)